MFSLILFEPEIPPNTGNIIRLCANTGTRLHLIKPLGFSLDERRLRRAGLDYGEFATVQVHDNLEACLQALAAPRVFGMTTHGVTAYNKPEFHANDAFLMGPETRGLPSEVLATLPTERQLRIPMLANSRSLNLANAAAVVVYEAWRQQGYQGGA